MGSAAHLMHGPQALCYERCDLGFTPRVSVPQQFGGAVGCSKFPPPPVDGTDVTLIMKRRNIGMVSGRLICLAADQLVTSMCGSIN